MPPPLRSPRAMPPREPQPISDGQHNADVMAMHLAPPSVEVRSSLGRVFVSGYGPANSAIKVVFPNGDSDMTWVDEHGCYDTFSQHVQSTGTVSVTVLNANGFPGLTAVGRYLARPTQASDGEAQQIHKTRTYRVSENFADTVYYG